MTQADPNAEPDPDLVRIWEFTELVAASARSTHQRDRVLRAAGVAVAPASFGVLRLLRRHGPSSMGEIARRVGVDQSTATRQVRPLEDHGLVSRSADPDDRRVAMLEITPAGLDVLRRTRAVALNDFHVALADWDPADRRLLADLVDRFRAGLLEARADETGWSYRPGTVDRATTA